MDHVAGDWRGHAMRSRRRDPSGDLRPQRMGAVFPNWRCATRLPNGIGSATVRVRASLVRAGEPYPLTGTGISVPGASRPTPVLAACPRQTRIAIDVPNTVTLPGGQPATFAGWRGSTMKTGDWSRRKGI